MIVNRVPRISLYSTNVAYSRSPIVRGTKRHTYNTREYIDFPKPELQAAWGATNVAMFSPKGGVGLGPAAWAHSLLPDQHAFRGSYGGWVFPLRNHGGETTGNYLAPGLCPGLSAAYGEPVSPEQVFDATLALLSATTYSTRFGRDVEDDFPHVPFPADVGVFHRASGLGARLRALQGFADPAPEYRSARLTGQASGPLLDLPTPSRAWVGGGDVGAVSLLRDQSLRLDNVSAKAWRFSVSGYQVLYRWLRARNGEQLDRTLQRAILDTVGRIEEIVALCDCADEVLELSVARSLSRASIGLPQRQMVEDLEVLDEPA